MKEIVVADNSGGNTNNIVNDDEPWSSSALQIVSKSKNADLDVDAEMPPTTPDTAKLPKENKIPLKSKLFARKPAHSSASPLPQQSHQQQQSLNNTTETTMSIYERFRHFLQINFALNKRTFIISILSYFADIMLFISLNLYLFSNQNYIYEPVIPSEIEALDNTTTARLDLNTYNNRSATRMIRALTNNVNLSASSFVSTTASLTTNLEPTVTIEKIRMPMRIKQSYLTLQIISIFAFFICFILSYLIKLQFKYHRIALNMYDYDAETYNNQDRDGVDSISSATPSHFSSSAAANNKKFSALLKRLLHKLLTKFATILLYFLFGYHFCQNCFIQQSSADLDEVYGRAKNGDGFNIFIHIFIVICVSGRCLISFLSKKFTMNQINYLKELQQKQKELLASSPPNNGNKKSRDYYYFSYYTYLIRSNQLSFNQLKQHENNQNTFRIFKLSDTALFIGFMAALFHLFIFIRAFELVFIFLPLLFILILLRLKSYLNAIVNLVIIFVSLLVISSFSSFNSITTMSDYVLKSTPRFRMDNAAVMTSTNETTTMASTSIGFNMSTNLAYGGNSDVGAEFILKTTTQTKSIINLFSYNLLTFFCFLITFYLNSLLSIYFCSLSCLERWNLSFLCKISFWRKLSIFISFVLYLIFILTCTIAICIKFKSWSFLMLPLFFLISFVWCLFQLLNTINLSHLMNKISDCYLLLNESSNNTTSNNPINPLLDSNHHHHHHPHHKKSKSQSSHNMMMMTATGAGTPASNSHHDSCSNGLDSSANRNSAALSRSSSNNGLTNFRLMKFLTRFLSYDKLNMKPGDQVQHSTVNIPIHRILAFKGIRHLGSISYRISLFCFIQTLMLGPFAFSVESPFTIGIYLIALCLNFIWVSLLYQFSKTITGSCIAYALVSPPQFASSAASMLRTAPSGTNTGLSKKYRTNSSSSTSGTTGTRSTRTTNTTTTTSSSTNNGSSIFLPFNIQQALSRRCTYILSRIHLFLQFHLIENYGCDYAGNGLSRDALEAKLRSFFSKRTQQDGSPFNTYLLYYCGPTSALTGDLTLSDGNELSMEQIIECWKEINCNASSYGYSGDKLQMDKKKSASDLSQSMIDNESQARNSSKRRSKPKKNSSRLIIILDAEHTSKSLQHVNSKINESNVYVALQSVKYTYNTQQNAASSTTMPFSKANKTSMPAINSISSKTATSTLIDENMVESYLNIGKFTLDWIKSNCNSYNIDLYDHVGIGNLEEVLSSVVKDGMGAGVLDEERQNIYVKNEEIDEDDEEEDEAEEDEEESDEFDSSSDEFNNNHATVTSGTADMFGKKKLASLTHHHNHHHHHHHHHHSTKGVSSSTFYEAKCAYSHYWTDFSFDANEKTAAQDVNQFWHIYYPYFICQPLLRLINCRLFYIRLGFVRKTILFLRRLRSRLVPLREYDTGHGFKLFSS